MKVYFMSRMASYCRIYLIITFLVILFLTITIHKRIRSNRFNRVIVFGDSFSDTGNAYALSNYAWPIDPPYYQGRSCEGPNWVDRLEVHEKYNYAYSGAITDNNFAHDKTNKRSFGPGVRQQILIYLNETLQRKRDLTLPLYIIWIGFNNFFLNLSIHPREVVNSFMDSIQDLLNVGAKNFLIFNQPPLQLFPCFKKFNQSTFYMQITDLFNQELGENLAVLQKNHSKVSIYMFDIHALVTDIISSTTFTNTVDGCWITDSSRKVGKLCSDPKKYVFFDTIHFTSSVHQLITNAIQPVLSSHFQQTTFQSYIHSF